MSRSDYLRAGAIFAVGTGVSAFILWLGGLLAQIILVSADTTSPESLTGEFVFTLAVFGGLPIAAIVAGKLTRVDVLAPGRQPLSAVAMGLILGTCGVSAATSYAFLAGGLSSEKGSVEPGVWLGASLLVLFQVMAEEIYFRGWLQRSLSAHTGAGAAILLTAVAFAILHDASGSFEISNLFLGGVFLGVLAQMRSGIAASVAAHFGWNWTEGMAFGLYPNPGHGPFGTVFDFELAGSPLWGGSSEGLNASIAMSIVFLALIVPMLILMKARSVLDVSSGAESERDRSGRAPS